MDRNTRQTLLKVTRAIIDSRGVEAVSMREVGRLAGLSRTASYRHFKNKESLLAEIVAEDFNVLLSMMLELENIKTHPKQILVKVLNAYYRFAMMTPEHYQLMFNTKWDNKKFPEIKTVALLVFQETAKYVDKAIQASRSPIYTSKEATAILYAFIHGLVELNLVGHKESEKGLDDPGLLIDKIIDAIF